MWEKILGKILPFIWPPGSDSTAQQQYIWRRNVAFFLYGEIFGMLMVVLLLLGFAPAWVPTPAWSGDITQLRGDIGAVQRSQQSDSKGIRLSQIKTDLKLTVTNYCLAIRMHNQLAIDYAWKDLQQLKSDYYDIVGRAWDQPPCDAVLVSN